LHEASELAVDVGAHELFEVTDRVIGDEDNGQIVALALGLAHDEVDRRLVAGEVEPLPSDPLGGQELLDPYELSNIAVLLKIDEHRSRFGAAARRSRSDATKVGEAGARAGTPLEFFEWGEWHPERHVETSREVLRKAHGQKRVPARGCDGAIESVAYGVEHARSSPETAEPVKRQQRAFRPGPSFAPVCNIAAGMSTGK
jgi:hypothetical protein